MTLMFDFLRRASPVSALRLTKLFWPEFVDLDGFVTHREWIEMPGRYEQLTALRERYGDDWVTIGLRINTVSVYGLFEEVRRLDVGHPPHYRTLTHQLAEMWSARLHQQFPGRRFHVQVTGEEPLEADLAI